MRGTKARCRTKMRELIDKHDAYMMLKAKAESYAKSASYHHYDHEEAYTNAARIINSMPTIEAEVRHGEWHECWYTDTVCASICTNCGQAATKARVIVGQELMTNVRYPLCPNCGARMDLRTPTEVELDTADSVMMGDADNG